ncbi:MAG TPA: efflux RND transporter permease subunit [Candidatus Hydrogenedentes bacterium]|nr:efflux RND transporter permease subunit [Candidatus Hydrogenedentota bacterium]HPG66123.1 efflux RND transporter permease subunit [Candidatus Hydrogenedentota bacterium]
MNISSLFIRRPVMTTLVVLGILLVGIQGYRGLPVSDLPNVDFPTLNVTASLPGASPETMASSVATPLERQFSTIAGIQSMNSTSVFGRTQVTLQFDLDRDIDAAAQDVQAAITLAGRDLPDDMPSPPYYRKVNPADQPILYLALSSPVLPLHEVNEYAETMIAQRVSMVSGVAQVQVYGSQKYAVRAQVDPRALVSRGIGIDEVSNAIQAGNVNMPSGDLQGRVKAYTLQAAGELYRAEDYGPLVVAWRNGSPVRLQDIGRVLDSVENDQAASWFNHTRAIVLAVQRQPGVNTIEVVNAVKRLLPSFREQMPRSVNMDILFDRTESIQASVHEVKFTLVLTIGLVVFVIFLFLRNVTATVIPTLALILSVVGTFAIMYLFGFSLDNLSLMALTLSVGFVVDDAIVMIENIVRHMENGEPPMAASFKGSSEIGFTIVSMTLSLTAVFIPVLFMGGIMGRLLREFAVTISMAILISGFVSLTQTPMLCSRFLRHSGNQRHGTLYNLLEKGFDGMLAVYRWSLGHVMRHRLATMVLLVGSVILTGYLFIHTPKGFLPSEDIGQVTGSTEGPQGISFEDMVRHQQEVARVIGESPYVDGFMSSVGSGGSGTVNTGRLLIHMKPRKERVSVDEFIQQMRPVAARIPGIRVFLQNRPSINVGGQMTKSLYQFTLQGTDTKELYHYAPILEQQLAGLDGFEDVTSDLLVTNPEVDVEIDRDKASSLGLSVRQIEDALYTAYGSRQISTIFAPNDQYRVILELLPEHQMDPNALSLLYVRSAHGQLVPLDTVAVLKRSVGPMTVTHLGQLPSVTISFNLRPGVALGDAVAQVNKVAAETLPATITPSFQGTAQAFEASMKGMGVLLLAAIIVIYIVLGILYESFLHPITILTGLPAAGIGALLTLQIFGMDLNIYSLVGIIMLMGIVKKNSIMMVDFAIERQRDERVTPAQAIHEACLIRFRPIMMTTMAALMGTLPIALSLGAGSEARRPLGMAVVGGLLVSQLLTLFITPVFYTYMESLRRLLQHSRSRRAPDTGHALE